jgi:hypothetical protein
MHATTYNQYDHATFIPSGMHQFHNRAAGYMQVRPAYERPVYGLGAATRAVVTEEIVDGLVAKGVHPAQARQLVQRAVSHHARLERASFAGLVRPAGIGDADPNVLAKIGADAKSVQASHQRLIDSMASWEERNPGWVTNDDDLRLNFQDQLTALKDQFVDRSLPLLGVQFPYQIDRSDPAGAIVLAIRDDIQNTIDLLDARKSQQVLQKVISDLSKVPLPNSAPNIKINIPDVPWYVWAGGAGVGLLALKQMLK